VHVGAQRAQHAVLTASPDACMASSQDSSSEKTAVRSRAAQQRPRRCAAPGCIVPSARALRQGPQDSFRVLARASLPSALHELAGSPAEVWLEVASPPGDVRLLLDIVWVNKTATRLPEVRGQAGCGGFCLVAAAAHRQRAADSPVVRH
jgi:hypothetical protein